MSRTTNLSILLSLLLTSAAACGGDSNSTPDGSTAPGIDATVDVADAAPGTPDADVPLPDADLGPDAMPIDHGLATARASKDGKVDVAINQVFVTYLKPNVGNDPAGFFVQADTTGPALFVAVDPATLTTPVTAGDEVSFTITEMGTTGALRQATAISTDIIHSSANDITGLVQDVSAEATLVSALDDFEAELVTAQMTVTGAAAGAGTGFQALTVDTAGVVGSTDLRLRLPVTMQDSIGLVPTCTVSLAATPLWRFASAAQLSALDVAELTADCPAPVPVDATAITETELTIEFDRGIDPASIVADGSQFTFDNGLVASAAVLDGRIVTITTGTMLEGQDYIATVADTVLDVLGDAVAV